MTGRDAGDGRGKTRWSLAQRGRRLIGSRLTAAAAVLGLCLSLTATARPAAPTALRPTADIAPSVRVIGEADLPPNSGVQVIPAALDGKRDSAALAACTAGVPLLSKLAYLDTGATMNPLFAIRGDTFTYGFPIGGRRVTSAILLGDRPGQAAQAVAALGTTAFATCFAQSAPVACVADRATCPVQVAAPLATPRVGDDSRAFTTTALVTEANATSEPRLTTVTYTFVQVGAAVGILGVAGWPTAVFPDVLRIRLAALLADRMKGLPLGANAPSPPLEPGQQAGGALAWSPGSLAGGVYPSGTLAAWDANNGHIIGYTNPAAASPSATVELQSGQTVALTPAHQPNVTGEALAYDVASGQLLLLGDYQGAQQTWIWDGTDWSQWTGPSPVYRTAAAFAYDNALARLVLFGGKDRQGADLGDTLQWSGAGWGRLPIPAPVRRGRPPSVPSPRDHAAMAYDPATQGLVLFGGFSAGAANTDTWLLTGLNWRTVRATRTPPSGSYWLVYMANSGKVVLVGRDTSGGWQQWTYDEPGVTWRPLLSTATPAVGEFWPTFDPAAQTLNLLPVDALGTNWSATFYSIDAEPAAPCTTYEVSDKSTNNVQLLVVGSNHENTTDLKLAADRSAAVTFRSRDASGPQVDIGVSFESGVGLDASFYALNVYNIGTGFGFTGAMNAGAAATTLHSTGDPTKVQPPIADGPDTQYKGGGVELGAGLSLSGAGGLASAGVSGGFTHVAGVNTNVKTGEFSVESETEVTASVQVAFVLGWTPSWKGSQKMSEDFDAAGHPLGLTSSWANQTDFGFDVAVAVDLEKKDAAQAKATPSGAPTESVKAAPGKEPAPGAADAGKQAESGLAKAAVGVNIDSSFKSKHVSIQTVEHRWSFAGAGGPDLLLHMNDPVNSLLWLAENASSATTVFLDTHVQSVTTGLDASAQFLLRVGYKNEEEVIDTALYSAVYIPPGGAPTPWVACTAGIGRPS